MSPTVSRLYDCNLEAIFKMQKLFTGFLYELQPSFHIHILCSHLYTDVLLKKLLTGFLYELQPSLRTYALLLPAHN
jgi:hypothetical protein